MGQTLTHGVYLPDEGERNCYNGLAANWQLLDGAVGTVAEHTSQIAGKAPLVHTHTKSDITDLFNSANTWSGDNTYSKPVAIEKSSDTGNFLALKNTVAELGSTPASATPATIAYPDKNNDNLGYMGMFYDTDGSNRFRLYVRNKFTSGAPSTSGTTDYITFQLRLNADQSKEGILRASFRPYDNNTYDLGSSSYQWNNLYAKNYYYNGTAWGLDKSNVWTENNSYCKDVILSNSFIRVGVIPTSGRSSYLYFNDNYGSTIGYLRDRVYTSGETQMHLSVHNKYLNGALNVNGSDVQGDLYLGIKSNGVTFMSVNSNSVIPTTTGVTDLGTSTNKWKTLNGVNPGALSLPDLDNTYRWSLDTTNWVLDGSANNTFTPNFSGWLNIRIPDVAGNYIIMQSGAITVSNQGTGALASTITRPLSLLIPVIEGVSGLVKVNAASITGHFYPALGNSIKTTQPSS